MPPFSQRPTSRRSGNIGFTLVELMVACVILSIIMLIVLNLTSMVGSAYKRSRANLDAFRDARQAFESMALKLSQATLNTYWDYEPRQVGASPPPPQRYVRQSELHFVCDKMLWPGQITHAVFFQVPMGVTDNQAAYGGLPSLLNACGYFVEFGSDKKFQPSFMQDLVPERHRFRLMEYLEDAEKLRVYENTDPTLAGYEPDNTGIGWATPTAAPPPARILAENVIALAVLPRRTLDDPSPAQFAPGYQYNSRKNARSDPQPPQAHQLPPLVELVLVAIDEVSASRLQDSSGSTQPDLGFSYADVFQDPDQLEESVAKVEQGLRGRNLTHRVFRTTVPMRNAKWSDL